MSQALVPYQPNQRRAAQKKRQRVPPPRNNQPQQVARAPRINPITGKSCVQMSAATSAYCQALCNPFDAAPCGVPLSPVLQTYKAKNYAKGTCHTGSSGVGFVLLAPNLLVANNAGGVYYSTPAYAGTTMEVAGAGVSVANANAPFPSSQFGDGAANLSFRMVASGLRIRYGGTELNRGGFKIALIDPTHDGLDGRDEASLLSDQQATRYPVNREWTSVIWRPIREEEYRFRFNMTGVVTEPYMGIMVVSPDASLDMLFEWEAYSIYEYQGATARGQTVTYSDPTGFAAVQSVTNTMTGSYKQPSHQVAATTHQSVMQYLLHGISGIVDTGLSALPVVQKAVRFAGSAAGVLSEAAELAAPVLALL
nr:MAG: hypothetical protein [Crogonang virus 50]